MTFLHKVSRRLALLRDVLPLAAVLLASCEMRRNVAGVDAELRVLQLSPTNVALQPTHIVDFTVVGLDQNGDTVDFSVLWSVTSGTMVDTGTNGRRHYGRYKAGSDTGRVKVIAKGRSSAIADTASVLVTLASVASVGISPPAVTIESGTSAQLVAVVRDSAGNELSGRSVTWRSGAAGVATVNSTGLVRGVAAGSATITATSDGQSGSAAVTVTAPLPPAPVASVTVSPASASVAGGATVELTATARDSAGNPLSGRVVTWTSGDVSVAIVSLSGVVSGVAVGTAVITATAEGKSGSSTITVTSSGPARTGYYASPMGTSGGDGSSIRPWDLATALAGGGGRVQPGDTVWVRGGTYRGTFPSTLSGTAGAPIVVRAYPGERAILDAGSAANNTLSVRGSYSVFWGLELINSDPNRILSTSGSGFRLDLVTNNGTHNKYINLIMHDGGSGLYTYTTQPDVEVYGCIVYNNGWQGPDRGHGHALYIKNDVGPVVLRDNILFNQFGYGVHGYTNAGSGQLNNIRIEGNVSFNNGSLSNNSASSNIMVAGNEPADQIVVKDNFTYFSPSVGSSSLRMGRGSLLDGTMQIEGNYLAGGSPVMDVGDWRQAVVTGNTFIGTGRMIELQDPNTSQHAWSGDVFHRDPNADAWRYAGTSYTFSDWRTATGLAASDQARSGAPATQVFVRPNAYEPGRAHIIVYNWGGLSVVAADLAGVLRDGERFEVRNVQDLFGAPVVSGVYTGGAVSLAMTGVTPPPPIGMAASGSPVTGPLFDVFLVTRVP